MTSNAFWVLSGADDRRAGVSVYLTVISLCDLPAGITRQIFLPMCVYMDPYRDDTTICPGVAGHTECLYVQYSVAFNIQ